MTYTPLLIVHISGGIVGVLSGFLALFVRKGSRLHRRSGDVFVIAMLCMAAGGGYLAFTKAQPVNVFAGLLTFYLVASAWLTVKRREGETGRAELGLLLVALAAGTGAWVLGWKAAHSPTGLKGGAPAAAYYVFVFVALLSASGDVRMLIRGGISGAQRIVRHLWRMCFALFVAAGSFFLGTASDPVLRRTGLRATLFTKAVRHTHLPEVPVIVILLLTIYWLCRVKFTNMYKQKHSAAPVPALRA